MTLDELKSIANKVAYIMEILDPDYSLSRRDLSDVLKIVEREIKLKTLNPVTGEYKDANKG